MGRWGDGEKVIYDFSLLILTPNSGGPNSILRSSDFVIEICDSLLMQSIESKLAIIIELVKHLALSDRNS